MHYYIEVLRKYAVFQGRARREEFWTFTLSNFIIYCILFCIYHLWSHFAIVLILYYLAVFMPHLGVQIRRLHDVGESGWWALPGYVLIGSFFALSVLLDILKTNMDQIGYEIVKFIGIIGLFYTIILLIFYCLDSQPEENQYGPNPKTVILPENNGQSIPYYALPTAKEIAIGMHYYVSVLKKYAVFQGRARRKEFWMFILFNAIILIILQFIGRLGLPFSIPRYLYYLAVILPSLGVEVRRMHDLGKSGWWILPISLLMKISWVVSSYISIVHPNSNGSIVRMLADATSLLGLISIIYFMVFCLDSQPGANKYGPNPKDITGDITGSGSDVSTTL